MQFLVTTRDNGDVDWNGKTALLKKEAEHVLSLYAAGTLRHIWFSGNKDAVLLFECDCIDNVRAIMDGLPLVSEALLNYDVTSLFPYSGFGRLMDEAGEHDGIA